MEFEHNIVMDFSEVKKTFVAVNYSVCENNINSWRIDIHLSGCGFRKNVSHLKVAKFINKFFLLEMICSMIRNENKTLTPLCEMEGKNNTYCPCKKALIWMNMD